MKFEFENDFPIDDPMTVLDLLYRSYDSRASTMLYRRPSDRHEDKPYVEIRYDRDFSYPTIYRYVLTNRVVDSLIAERAIIGKPEWGYRSSWEFVLTLSGSQLYQDKRADVTKDIQYHHTLRAEEWYKRLWRK